MNILGMFENLALFAAKYSIWFIVPCSCWLEQSCNHSTLYLK